MDDYEHTMREHFFGRWNLRRVADLEQFDWVKLTGDVGMVLNKPTDDGPQGLFRLEFLDDYFFFTGDAPVLIWEHADDCEQGHQCSCRM